MGPQERSSHSNKDEVKLSYLSISLRHFSHSQKSSHANQVGSSFSSRNSGVQVAGGIKETVSCQTAPQEEQEEKLLVRQGLTKFSMANSL